MQIKKDYTPMDGENPWSVGPLTPLHLEEPAAQHARAADLRLYRRDQRRRV